MTVFAPRSIAVTSPCTNAACRRQLADRSDDVPRVDIPDCRLGQHRCEKQEVVHGDHSHGSQSTERSGDAPTRRIPHRRSRLGGAAITSRSYDRGRFEANSISTPEGSPAPGLEPVDQCLRPQAHRPSLFDCLSHPAVGGDHDQAVGSRSAISISSSSADVDESHRDIVGGEGLPQLTRIEHCGHPPFARRGEDDAVGRLR